MKKFSIILISIALSGSSLFASEYLTSKCKEMHVPISTEKASPTTLAKAMALLYSVPEVGKCMYPEVVVKKIFIGEYEKVGDDKDKLTLTNRISAEWNGLEIQQAVLSTPENSNLYMKELPSGQLVFTTVSKKSDPGFIYVKGEKY